MNLLLVQLKRIGDLILTSPAIGAVRDAFPEAKISLIVSRDCRALVPAIPGIDAAVVLRGNVSDARKCLSLLSTKFDACIDFAHNDRSAFVTLLSGADKRITAEHVLLQSKLRARSYTELVACSLRTLHTIDYHLCLLEPLGISQANGSDIRLELPATANEGAATLVGETPFVLLHPGSARPEKFWEPDRWARIAEYAREKLKLRPVITGSAAGVEGEHIAAICAQAGAPVLDLAGKTDLLTLAALVARARLLVTVDSAPMHFAAAFATPQVALFGPTNPLHWRPRSTVATVLQGDSGIPIEEFTPNQKPLPMNLISTEAVIGAMEARLAATAASPL